MIGCSKKNKKSCKNKVFSTLGNKQCQNCGPNCHCGPNCNCPHPCPGNCYLNRRSHKVMKKHRGGGGCGACGCPYSPLSWKQMNQFGGNMGAYPEILKESVIIDPVNKSQFGPVPGIAQNGGSSCGQCGQVPVNPQSGGSFFKQVGPMPGPFVGSPWGPDKLPGQNGIGGDRNYLKSYADVITNDPAQQMSMNDAGYKTMNSMVGGYTYSKKPTSSSASKKGGGLVPQDLVNLGRDFSFNFKSAYNALNGYKAPVNPAPYKDQLTGALNTDKFMKI